ncbi:hypothetical protein [Hufsiella ginkgonis]|uniref:Uncharacterized protein n=1 Tax=Hufsiella ginkgonis TaxID=2695274 RepID=A0A7K1Y3U6_9SPHI|nr:hypothetical protein [Hufsiella ginkgonis]MXV17729.1 hypothetical protein [Hufsiella ginkgonis]
MENNIEESLSLSIDKNTLLDIGTDWAEFGLDTLLDGPLKDIPVFGTILNFGKTGLDISNYYFTKKVASFLFNLSKISRDKRRSFADDLKNSEGKKRKVAERLVIVLNKYDETQKAQLLANAFAAYIENKISHDDFVLLSMALDGLAMVYVRRLYEYYTFDYRSKDDSFLDALFRTGLVTLKKQSTFDGGREKYEKNNLGKNFRDHVIPSDQYNTIEILTGFLRKLKVDEDLDDGSSLTEDQAIELLKTIDIDSYDKIIFFDSNLKLPGGKKILRVKENRYLA